MKNATLVATVTAATDVTSSAFDLGDLTTFAVMVNFSGSDVVGTLTLQSSNDGSTWVTVASSSQAVTASGDHIWNVSSAGYRYVRTFWDYTSGTGNITVTLVAKEIRVVGA